MLTIINDLLIPQYSDLLGSLDHSITDPTACNGSLLSSSDGDLEDLPDPCFSRYALRH